MLSQSVFAFLRKIANARQDNDLFCSECFRHMNESITITYSTVLNRCKMLSAFEGRDRYDAAGRDLYSQVAIAEQDSDLIMDYLKRALVAVREGLDDMITAIDVTSSSQEVWTLRSVQRRWDKKGYTKLGTNLHEALAASVMAAWMSYKGIQDRSTFYQTLYDNEMKLISDNLHTKAAPTRPTT